MKRYIGLVLGLVCLIAVAMVAVAQQRNDKAAAPAVDSTEAAKPKQTYVALGDSVAAGFGLKTPSDWRYCSQTNESYPHLLAAQHNYQLLDYSCRDARTDSGLLQSQLSNGATLTAQQDQLFKAAKTPQLVSLTIGANDINWTQLLQRCYTASCGSAADSAAAQAAIAGMGQRLQQFLAAVGNHYGTRPPRVVVTGYYNIFPAQRDPACFDTAQLDSAELAWWNSQQAALNQAIQTAAATAPFARYATINFSGHELCSASPWVQDITSPAPIHPTAEGQAALAKAVEAASN